MIKKILSTFLAVTLVASSIFLVGCGKEKTTTLQKVKLNEVVRSVFYAPMYVALNEGFFKAEGLDIELSTGQGADATLTKTQVLKLSLC